ncbi:MAG: 30S ribosomal protein S2, partial [Nitrospinota bacterium]|nr:30S ribosomal protein S2 [Nitrospinota bacterium]
FPGNDDAIRSIKLFTSRIADVVIEGQEIFKAGRKDDNFAKEEKPETTPKTSDMGEDGGNGSTETDLNSESTEEKVPA